VQGRLEEWEQTLADVASRASRKGSLRPRTARKIASKAWRSVIDPGEVPPRSVRRRFRDGFPAFLQDARRSLEEVASEALAVDASRFRSHLATKDDVAQQIRRHLDAITALLQGEQFALESVSETAPADDEGEATDA